MVKDSAPEKWEYKEHTWVKHKLLSKYFSTWIKILGTGGKRKLTYFDCFAGRGQMIDGSDGSPVIAIKIADRNAKHYREMVFTFIEKDAQNFDNLTQVLQTLKQEIENVDKITIVQPIHNDFNSSVNQIFGSLDAQRRTIAPSLFFIDPFGYSGIPLDTIKKILSYPRTEIFFTFMVSSITRFLSHEPVSETLTSLFGTDEWIQVIGQPNEERA
jgi:three-Cys-motif partner protein